MKIPKALQQKLLGLQGARPKQQSKYRNRRATVDGQTFDSRKEARRYLELQLLARAGEITGLTRQQSYRLEVNGVLVCSYRPDFEYRTKDGTKVVEDVKGVKTQTYKLKKKLMKAIYGITITET